jgi:ABC-type glycerol-3-phosphate transport system permease component
MADMTQTIDEQLAAGTIKMGRRKPSYYFGKFVLYGLLIGGAIIAMIPFYWMLSNSLMTLGETLNRQWVPSTIDFTDIPIGDAGREEVEFDLGSRTIEFQRHDEQIQLTFGTRRVQFYAGRMVDNGADITLSDEPIEVAVGSATFNVTSPSPDIVEIATGARVLELHFGDERFTITDDDEVFELKQFGLGIPLPANYVEAWEDAKFGKYFLNSVIITLLTISGMVVTSVLAGYAFGRINFWGRNVVFTLLLTTLMIPESVTMIPNFLMVRGDILSLPHTVSGFPFIGFGGSWLNTLPALTVPFMANAFAIFLLRQFFAQIPEDLWDAARIDGCGHLRFLLVICLPISRPAVMTVVLLTFISAWNAFLWPLIVTTRDTWRPLMVGLWNFVSEAGPQTHLLMAGSVITIIPILVLYFMTQKSFTEGIATSGLKG